MVTHNPYISSREFLPELLNGTGDTPEGVALLSCALQAPIRKPLLQSGHPSRRTLKCDQVYTLHSIPKTKLLDIEVHLEHFQKFYMRDTPSMVPPSEGFEVLLWRWNRARLV